MGRSAVEHPIGIPSAGFVNCSSNIHSAAGFEAPYRDETQVLANPPHSLYGFWKDRQNRGINAPFIPAMLFSEIHTTSVSAGVIKMEERQVKTFKNLLHDESGQDLIEYALVAALIALGAIVSMKALATGISGAFSTISSDLTSSVA